MISFNKWIELKEIAVSGDIEVPEQPSFRRGSKLTPDPMVGKVFGMVLKPSTLSMIRAFGTDSGGLPKEVQGVLDTIEDGALIMSNEDMVVFRDLANRMVSAGGFMKAAADDILNSLEGAVREATRGKIGGGGPK